MKRCTVCGELNDELAGKCENCGSDEFLTVKTCRACHAEREPDALFCPNCGHTFSEKDLSDGEGFMQCPYCDADIRLESDACPFCGKVLSKPSDVTVKKIVCPNCRSANDLSAGFCSYCFFGLEGAEPAEMELILRSDINGGGIVQNILVSRGVAKLVCPDCGLSNDLNGRYCLNCGRPLRMESPKKYCGSCGAENPEDASFCMNCQSSFEGKIPVAGEKYWTCGCTYENSFKSEYCIACGRLRGAK